MTEALLSSRPPTYHVYNLDQETQVRESIARHRELFNPSVNFQLLVLDMDDAGMIDHLDTWILGHGRSIHVLSTSGDFPDLLVYPPDVDGLLTIPTLPKIKLIKNGSIPDDAVFWAALQQKFPRTVFVLTDETDEVEMRDGEIHRVLVVPELAADFSVPSQQ